MRKSSRSENKSPICSGRVTRYRLSMRQLISGSVQYATNLSLARTEAGTSSVEVRSWRVISWCWPYLREGRRQVCPPVEQALFTGEDAAHRMPFGRPVCERFSPQARNMQKAPACLRQ
jgi:hypothetical protein